MAYDINTYKTTLDNYLTSGIKYLRYVRKRMGKAMIFYPIINDAQIKSFVIDHIYNNGKASTFDNAKPYSEWDWFQSNYDIIGLKELDTSVTASYFVLIVGSNAALIKLNPLNYDIKRLNDRSVYDIQTYFLLKASKRIARGSHFYRYDYAYGRFVYGDKRLPFQLVSKIATDRAYTSDSIFIDYIQLVSIDDVDSLLHKLLERYIRGCKGTDNSVSKQSWLSHTKALFDIQKFPTANLETIREAIIHFCEQQMNATKVIDPTKLITAHYTSIKSTVNVDKLYECLITEGLIDTQTTKDDFTFFFSGKGSYPSKKIKWVGAKVKLAILIAKLHANSLTDWKTTEAIFEDVKGNNLKKQYGNCKSESEKTIEQLIARAQ